MIYQSAAINTGSTSTPSTAATTPGAGGVYQAVFLANSQVYFGKLADHDKQFMKLTDIYYLQVTQPIQPAPKGQTVNPAINLIKLGGEVHGPADEMDINRDQVVLIEDLRADSNLVKAIENYKANQAKPAAK